jgi:murein DD-endopeptidase MepM/ murein hydrolase activator NlpD
VRRRGGALLIVAAAVAGCRPLVLSPYGSRIAVGRYRDRPPQTRYRRHDGVDIRAYDGDPVLASAGGVVIYVEFSDRYGTEIRIDHHRYHRVTQYLHLAGANVRVGDVVERGQVIGTVGLFPASDGVVHVHWGLCTRPACGAWHDGTEDPIEITAGCFDPKTPYPTTSLVLTYPVACG